MMVIMMMGLAAREDRDWTPSHSFPAGQEISRG